MAADIDFYESKMYKLRIYEDPFEAFPHDVELRKRFRFDQRTIMDITDLIRSGLKRDTRRGIPLPAETKMMIALRYLASNLHLWGSKLRYRTFRQILK